MTRRRNPEQYEQEMIELLLQFALCLLALAAGAGLWAWFDSFIQKLFPTLHP